MAACGEVVLRQRFCRACQAMFFLCRHCDRGQHYCSFRCRRQARLRQRSRANRRYQQSPEGRADHKDRQQRYRERGKARVTGHSSQTIVSPPSSPCGLAEAPPTIVPSRLRTACLPPQPESRPGVLLCCRICGRAGRFIDPFPHIPKRR
jgi:hypothetical protein